MPPPRRTPASPPPRPPPCPRIDPPHPPLRTPRPPPRASSAPQASPTTSQAPSPRNPPADSSPAAHPPRPIPAPARPGQPIPTVLSPQAVRQAATTTRGLAEGSRRFGRAVWAPAVRLSGVLWLELTGVFFALFALVAGIAAWRLRPALHASPFAGTSDDHTRLLFAVGMILVFGYFSFSSFLKANRRSRRP